MSVVKNIAKVIGVTLVAIPASAIVLGCVGGLALVAVELAKRL